MQEVLRKLKLEDEEGKRLQSLNLFLDVEGSISIERLKELSELEDIWEGLTKEERDAFTVHLKELEKKQLDEVLGQWIPWWESTSPYKPANIDIREAAVSECKSNANLNSFIEVR